MKIAIIGAGITGLSTAYYLSKSDENIEVDVIEASDRAGGKVFTHQSNGYTIELGPESYLERKKDLTELAEEIGLGDDLVRNQTGTAYIYVNGKLSPLPDGTMLGIPTEIGPFLKTDIISPLGKLRAGVDLFMPRVKMNNDISAGAFFRKRLGNEVVDHMVEPLLSGVYSTPIDELSLMSTFPMFKESEETHGSMIKGMLANKKARQKSKMPGQKKGQFLQFKNGLQSFIDQLKKVNEAQRVNFLWKTKVSDIQREGNQYQLTMNDTKKVYDKVIITTSHFEYKYWFNDAPLEYFKHMHATSVATVVMAFDDLQVENDIEGTGFVVSRKENTSITACTWTNKKWAHSTPKGKVLLRAYIGRPGENYVEDASDATLVKLARKDLDKIMTIHGEPEFSIVTKLNKSMPNYVVGHKERIEGIEAYMNETYPGLKLIGASHYAVGLPDCVKHAKKTAEEILREV